MQWGTQYLHSEVAKWLLPFFYDIITGGQAEQAQASQATHVQVDSKQVGPFQVLDVEASQQEAEGRQEGAQERGGGVAPPLD